LKAEKLTNMGIFKMLLSGDAIRAQKKHGQPFDFRNIAKLIFSANEIPESNDQTYAYFKHWIIPRDKAKKVIEDVDKYIKFLGKEFSNLNISSD
jgi:phage/plasmid-associated DNA primase